MDKSNQITLTNDQKRVFNMLIDFIQSKTVKVFILCGYAGTGKTTMMRYFINELKRRNELYSLHASTGRAAKILSNATGINASTVHSLLYKFTDFNQDLEEFSNHIKAEKGGQLLLQFSTSKADRAINKDTKYYIIDEASMLSDLEDPNPSQAIFGSGKLLQDLFNYDEFGKFIFVGDVAQLPPVKATFSPALSADYIKTHYHIKTVYTELTQIMRQSDDNDLVKSANKVRLLYSNPPIVKWGRFPLRNYIHIKIKANQIDLLNAYIKDIQTNGYNQSTMITKSNKLCSLFTKAIRPALGFNNECLCVGDLLMITQNNLISGLMNGDLVRVIQIGHRIQRANLTFLHIEVEELFTMKRYSQLLIEDIIYGQQINLSQSQQQELFMDFYYRMKNKKIKQSSPLFNENMLTDKYLNALRAVYGYVLTCHKAQGGEWKNVYLDIPRNMAFTPTAATYQWLYTAMTRASDTLHICNDFFIV